MNHLIIGMGEIGKAVSGLFPEAQTLDMEDKVIKGDIDVAHICFPYSDKFVDDVEEYYTLYRPTHLVIYSTVPIGTTASLSFHAVHSPVEGKHPDLALSILQMERWVASTNPGETLFFYTLFDMVGLHVRKIADPSFTEALKLLSTTEYGVNIEFARYKAWVADQIGMPYELTKEWNREYNKLYSNLGMDKRFQKFVLDAPEGPKGGHCVTPNARLLNEQFPNELVEIVGEI